MTRSPLRVASFDATATVVARFTRASQPPSCTDLDGRLQTGQGDGPVRVAAIAGRGDARDGQ